MKHSYCPYCGKDLFDKEKMSRTNIVVPLERVCAVCNKTVSRYSTRGPYLFSWLLPLPFTLMLLLPVLPYPKRYLFYAIFVFHVSTFIFCPFVQADKYKRQPEQQATFLCSFYPHKTGGVFWPAFTVVYGDVFPCAMLLPDGKYGVFGFGIVRGRRKGTIKLDLFASNGNTLDGKLTDFYLINGDGPLAHLTGQTPQQ